MVFKVKEVREIDGATAEYNFTVLSEVDGIQYVLVDYRLAIPGKKKPQRWSNIGDDGTFVKRSSIVIPDDVVESVRSKIVASISERDNG